MAAKRKIVLIGGGSNAWAPNIVKDMMLTEAISDSEFVLYDTDKPAGDLVKQFEKRTPVAASRSRWGGRREPCP